MNNPANLLLLIVLSAIGLHGLRVGLAWLLSRPARPPESTETLP